MSRPQSPDTVLGHVPKRFPDIRRVTRTPLALFFGVVVAVLAAFAYTVYDRTEQPSARAAEERSAVEPVEPDLAFSGAPDAGLIPMATPPEPVDLGAASPLPELPDDAIGPRPALDTRPAPLDPAAERLAQLQQQADQARVQAAIAAIGASTSAQGFEGGAQAAAGGQPPSFLPPSSGGNPLAELERLAASIGGGAPSPTPASTHAAFLSAGVTPAYSSSARQAARDRFELKAGSVIPGVMVSGINSDLPGQIIAQVREPVRDSLTGQTVLIPQGAKLIGVYDSHVARGQRRILVAWTRVLFPDGSSLDLERAPGADAAGYAGLSDKVDNRTFAVFRDALLLSAFSAGAQISQGGQQTAGGALNSQQIAAAAVGAQLSQTGAALIERNANIQPTLTIRPGLVFNVSVTKDFILPPFRG